MYFMTILLRGAMLCFKCHN